MILTMNTRVKYSAGLLCMGLLLACLPLPSRSSLTIGPAKVLDQAVDATSFVTVDQVAGFVVAEDQSVRLIDLRSRDEFRKMNIPGSLNLPYDEFFDKYPGTFLLSGKTRNILYSNGDEGANYAFILARGMHFNNTLVMSGGLNEWYKTVMNSTFTGETITPRENALFETRIRARKMFTAINSLPDSLKLKYMENKHLAAKKLDGGCE